MVTIQGAITAMITPMQGGKLDEQGLRDFVEFQIAEGIDGLVPCGTTGESATLGFDEHKQVVDLTVQAVKGRVPVIAGTGANNTLEAIEFTESAKASGADAVLSVAPYYNKPSQEGIYQHFKAILDAVDIPMLLYNVPGRTVVNIEPATVARLAQFPNVIGIKEASANLSQVSELIRLCPEDFIVLSGDDFTAMPTMFLGGRGLISVVSNLEPARTAAMLKAAANGDIDLARKLHYELYALMGAMFCCPSPAPAKYALHLMRKIASPEVRLPIIEPDTTAAQHIRHCMQELGLLP